MPELFKQNIPKLPYNWMFKSIDYKFNKKHKNSYSAALTNIENTILT